MSAASPSVARDGVGGMQTAWFTALFWSTRTENITHEDSFKCACVSLSVCVMHSHSRSLSHTHAHTLRGSSWEAASSAHHSGQRYFPKRKKHHFVTGAAHMRTEVTNADHKAHPHTCHTTARLLIPKYQLILHPLRVLHLDSDAKYCHGAPSLPEGTHGSPAHHVEIVPFLNFLFCLFVYGLVCRPRLFIHPRKEFL